MIAALLGFTLFLAVVVPPLEPTTALPDAGESVSVKRDRELTPEDLETLTAASIEFQSGRYQSALAILEKAATKSPPHPETLNLRGAALVELGRQKEAGQIFRWVLEIEPTHFWAQFNLAEIALLDRDILAARRLFLSVPRGTSAEDELVNLKILLIDLRSNDLPSARNHLPKWPPVSAAGYAAYAAMANAEGDSSKRIELIEQARSLHPEQFGAFLQKTLEESGIPLN